MKKIKNLLALLATTLLLAACGGGGDATDTPPPEPPAPPSFPVAQALANYARTPATQAFTISGKVLGIEATGSGSETSSAPAADTFNGSAVQGVTRTGAGEVTVAGETFPFSGSRKAYYDANFKPVGFAGDGSYSIVSAGTPEVTSARIGDSGTLYSYLSFAQDPQGLFIGTVTVTYALEADTDSTALLKLTETVQSSSGTGLGRTVSTYRIGTDGSLQRLSEQSVMADFDLTFTFSPETPVPAAE